MTKRVLEDKSAELLKEWDDRLPWSHSVGSVTASEILRGSDETQLVVVAATSPRQPLKADLQSLWRARSKGGVTPVLVAVTYPHGDEQLVALLGLTDDAHPVSALERTLAEQLIREALRATSPVGLHMELRRRLASLAGGVASGVRNEGLFASHVLELQSEQSTWTSLCAQSEPLMGKRGENLLTGLGYTVEAVPDGTVLRSAGEGHRRAAAILLSDDESFENPLSRFQNNNAVMHGLALARREHLDWLVVLGGPVIRLYPVDPDLGVGRKGQTQTYVELDLSLLTAGRIGFLALLFSPDALSDNGSITKLLNDSTTFATGLSERLRDRIYVDVIPTLSVAVADKMHVGDLPKDEQKDGLDEAYHQSMIILFRLLFVAYAEDRRLLPYEVNERYTRNALKTLAKDLLGRPDQAFDPNSTTLWDDLTQVWKVIDTGDMDGWGVPAYNGGLFTRDATKNPSGAATYRLDLTNDHIGPVLSGLLIDISQDDVLGPVDFRSLSVREFGTIYEGLLESGLGIAETDLTLDQNDTYVPAKTGETVAEQAGSVYFHSRSGSRKATGSYFTKPFAVEHLLDRALEPAIDGHLIRVKRLLDAGATKSAGEALFDFRVTDLSMGSAHFLVAAIDRIEARFSAFLIEHPLPEVAVELHQLRAVAATQMGLDAAESGIDDSQLLRRQIARRCIYGLDINEIAVELARLGIWIHTFVPGLPLSFLNHGLVWGNSLTGVGTLPEITQAFAEAEVRELKRKSEASVTLLDGVLGEFLDRAGEHLAALGALSDASIGDVAHAATIQADIEGSLAPLRALCDLITAERATRHLGTVRELTSYTDKFGHLKQVKKSAAHPDRVLLSASPALFTATTAADLEIAILAHPDLERAKEIAKSVMAKHLPVSYPEVFRRERPGFDCVLGNPPWEKIKVDEPDFWYLRLPETRSLSTANFAAELPNLRASRPDLARECQAETARTLAMRQILSAAAFATDDGGDVDLSKYFAGRFWQLLRPSGQCGVVLPRTILSGSGTSTWRREILRNGAFTMLATCVNSAEWVFAGVEPRITISLVCFTKGSVSQATVLLCGPFHTLSDFKTGVASPAQISAESILRMTDGAAVPTIEGPASADVFEQMCGTPRFDSPEQPWALRPLRELDTALAKTFAISDVGAETKGTWTVYGGASFNVWNPDTGNHHSYAPSEVAIETALRLMRSGRKRARSGYSEIDASLSDCDALPCNRPRIAFRRIARSTDSRTFVCALLPPHVLVSNTAPTLLRTRGSEREEAFLLGVCSSIPFDWFARKIIEFSVAVETVNALPIPDASDARDPRVRRVIEISGRLAAIDARYADWARQVGVPVGSVTTDAEKDGLICELDALVSLLYGLSEGQVATVFETFHRGWDCKPRLAKVLDHFKVWASTIAVQGSAQ